MIDLTTSLLKGDATALSKFVETIRFDDIKKACEDEAQAYEVKAALNNINQKLKRRLKENGGLNNG